MKKLLLIVCAFISLGVFAQEYTETLLWDLSGVTGDTTRPVSYKNKDKGALVEVDFSNVNCNVLQLNFGYGTNDVYPNYLDTIPDLALPVTLDTTVYTNTYLGVESNVLTLDVPWYDGNYLWFNLIYDGACTSGEIKLRLKK